MNNLDEYADHIRELVREGKLDLALAECDLAIVEWRAMDIHHALSLRGYVKWRRGEKVSALVDYRLAALLAPTHAGHEYQVMIHSIDLARYDDAIEAGDRLLAIEKERESEAFVASARLHQLFCFAKLGRNSDFEKTASRLNPEERARIVGRDWNAAQLHQLLEGKGNPS